MRACSEQRPVRRRLRRWPSEGGGQRPRRSRPRLEHGKPALAGRGDSLTSPRTTCAAHVVPRHRVRRRAPSRVAHLVEDRDLQPGSQHPASCGEQRQLVGAAACPTCSLSAASNDAARRRKRLRRASSPATCCLAGLTSASPEVPRDAPRCSAVVPRTVDLGADQPSASGAAVGRRPGAGARRQRLRFTGRAVRRPAVVVRSQVTRRRLRRLRRLVRRDLVAAHVAAPSVLAVQQLDRLAGGSRRTESTDADQAGPAPACASASR